MNGSKSDAPGKKAPNQPAPTSPRRVFLGNVVKTASGLLFGDLVASTTAGAQAPAISSPKFTQWGWPLPYEQISAKSKQCWKPP